MCITYNLYSGPVQKFGNALLSIIYIYRQEVHIYSKYILFEFLWKYYFILVWYDLDKLLALTNWIILYICALSFGYIVRFYSFTKDVFYAGNLPFNQVLYIAYIVICFVVLWLFVLVNILAHILLEFWFHNHVEYKKFQLPNIQILVLIFFLVYLFFIEEVECVIKLNQTKVS